MKKKVWRAIGCCSIPLALGSALAAQTGKVFRVELSYQEPGNRPAPDFTPGGTPIGLSEWPANTVLPQGAMRPAKTGIIAIGPDRENRFRILMTADSNHPRDLCRLYVDLNRNGDFTDD